MKQTEIETKVGAKIDNETINVVVGRKVVTARLTGATLNDQFKPVLSYVADAPKKEARVTKQQRG